MSLRFGDLVRAAKQQQDDAQREEFERQISEGTEALKKLSPEVQFALSVVALRVGLKLLTKARMR